MIILENKRIALCVIVDKKDKKKIIWFTPVNAISYSMILLECNIRNLYNSAPEHRSMMRIAPLERAQKTVFLCLFLIFCCNMKFFYNNSSKNLEISNTQKLAFRFSF